MACNAVATVTAAVDLGLPETIAKYLDDKAAAAVILAAVQARYSDAAVRMNPQGAVITANYGGLTVVYSNGTVKVTQTGRGWNISQAEVDGLAEELTGLLKQAAAILLQEKVKQALSAAGKITNRERFKNGTTVYTVEL